MAVRLPRAERESWFGHFAAVTRGSRPVVLERPGGVEPFAETRCREAKATIPLCPGALLGKCRPPGNRTNSATGVDAVTSSNDPGPLIACASWRRVNRRSEAGDEHDAETAGGECRGLSQQVSATGPNLLAELNPSSAFRYCSGDGEPARMVQSK